MRVELAPGLTLHARLLIKLLVGADSLGNAHRQLTQQFWVGQDPAIG